MSSIVDLLSMYPQLEGVFNLGGVVFGEFVIDWYIFRDITSYINGKKYINVMIDDNIKSTNAQALVEENGKSTNDVCMQFHSIDNIKNMVFRFEHDGLCIKKVNNRVKYSVLPQLLDRIGLIPDKHEIKMTTRILCSLRQKQICLVDATSNDILGIRSTGEWHIMDACFDSDYNNMRSCLLCGKESQQLIKVGCCGGYYHRGCYTDLLMSSKTSMTRCVGCHNNLQMNRKYRSTYCCILF